MQAIKLYGIAFAVFVVVDLVWLAAIAKNLYQKELGYILAKSPNWTAAIVFYLLYLVGLVYFVIYPAVVAKDWTLALKNGVFFGFITYATYDLTNLATLKDWPLKITIIDLIWGSFLGGTISTVTFWINQLTTK